jgi:MoxR-like ATPase
VQQCNSATNHGTIANLPSFPTVLPLLDKGRVVYQDSPLVQAVEHGRILVVDEADKAPLEVVCLLKSLVEDGQLRFHLRPFTNFAPSL